MKLTPFSDESVLGIDIGTCSIKVVETKFSAGKPVALRAASAEIDLSKVTDPKGKWEAYVGALKEIISRNKITAKTAVIGVPNTAVALDMTRSPKKNPGPGGMPFEGREVETCAQPFEWMNAGGGAEKGTLLTTADRGAVIDRFEIVRDAGLVPVIADINIFAVLNAYLPSDVTAVKGLVFVLDIGAGTTEMAVLRGGLLMAVRTVFLAGNNFTVALQRELDVPAPAAEASKKKHGLLALVKAGEYAAAEGPGTALEKGYAVKIADLLAERVDQVSAEIRRTVAYYADKAPGLDTRVARLVLTGGSAGLPGLAEYLGAEFGVPVEIFRPLKTFDSSHLADKAGEDLPCFAVAAGLSMRRWPRERASLFVAVNLLPKALRRRSNPVPGIIGYLLLAAALTVGYYQYKAFHARINSEMLKHKAEVSFLKIKMAKVKETVSIKKAAKQQEPAAVKGKMKAAVKTDSYAYLKKLAISGVFTDSSGASAILSGPGGSYIVKNGKMFDESGKAVQGVSASITKKLLVLSAGGKKYEITIPK